MPPGGVAKCACVCDVHKERILRFSMTRIRKRKSRQPDCRVIRLPLPLKRSRISALHTSARFLLRLRLLSQQTSACRLTQRAQQVAFTIPKGAHRRFQRARPVIAHGSAHPDRACAARSWVLRRPHACSLTELSRARRGMGRSSVVPIHGGLKPIQVSLPQEGAGAAVRASSGSRRHASREAVWGLLERIPSQRLLRLEATRRSRSHCAGLLMVELGVSG